MLSAIITALLALFVAPGDADALRSTAPTYLTADAAREHLAAARLASFATGMDADLLLSIAWHESRYQHDVISKEPGGKVSCGVMTPVPMKRCPRDITVLDGYMAGALHLRDWVAAKGHMGAALLGYAGGYVGIRFCADAANRADYRCSTPAVFQHRARWIRTARKRVTSRPYS